MILSNATTISVKKNDRFNLSSGNFAHKKVFVISGHFKQFYVQDDGTEKILSFGFAGDYLLEGFWGIAMNVHVQAMSDAELLVFEVSHKENCSCLTQRLTLDICNYALKQFADHVYVLGLRTPFDRYKYVSDHKPEILSYIALTELSKYLNTSREALSRARISLVKKSDLSH